MIVKRLVILIVFAILPSLTWSQIYEKANLPVFVMSGEFDSAELLELTTARIKANPERLLLEMIGFVNTSKEHYKQFLSANLLRSYFHYEIYFSNHVQSKLFEIQIIPKGTKNEFEVALVFNPLVQSNPLMQKYVLLYLCALLDLKSYSTYNVKTSVFLDLLKDLNINDQMIQRINPIQLFEMSVNSEKGSLYSQLEILRINDQVLSSVLQNVDQLTFIDQNVNSSVMQKHIDDYCQFFKLKTANSQKEVFKAHQEFVQQKITKDLIGAKQDYREKYQIYELGKADRDRLDKTLRLSQMVKQNDRSGVASVLEKFIPWSLLEPTEVVLWQQFVESIRNPDWQNSLLLFRGIDSKEKMQYDSFPPNQLVNFSFFSKRLTAGSGSHLFKLKGLPGTFEKAGVLGNTKEIKPYERPHLVYDMLINHAYNPQGSMYISATYSPEIALSFSERGKLVLNPNENIEKAFQQYRLNSKSGGMASLLIDPRRFIINTFSKYTSEVELLIPLIVFPDEVIYLEKAMSVVIYRVVDPMKSKSDPGNLLYVESRNISLNEYLNRLRPIYMQKTGQSLPDYVLSNQVGGGSHTNKDVVSLRYELFRGGVSQLRDLYYQTAKPKVELCERLFF